MSKPISIAARLTMVATTVVGVFFVSRAVVSTDLGFGLLTLIALTVALSGLSVDVRRRSGSQPLSVPLCHVAMFAGALALGPPSALAGAFGGMASLILGPAQKRSLLDIFHIIFKPAVVCAVSSAAFAAAGGHAPQPHFVSSIVPAALAGAVYVVGHALTTVGVDRARARAAERPAGASVAASWFLCLIAGYSVAALYAATPVYVMVAPVLAGVLALAAVKPPPQVAEVVERVEETAEDTIDEPDEPESQDEPASQVITPSVFVDELTGLASHRYLMMFLDREVNRSLRTGAPLAVAAFDIDGFSGLDNAEQALVRLGERLKAGLRGYDLVARHASGRLVVALPDTSAQSAMEVCRRLHSEASAIEADGKPVTVSVGIAMLPGDGTSAEELINASHYALNKGRFSGEGGLHFCERLDKAS